MGGDSKAAAGPSGVVHGAAHRTAQPALSQPGAQRARRQPSMQSPSIRPPARQQGRREPDGARVNRGNTRPIGRVDPDLEHQGRNHPFRQPLCSGSHHWKRQFRNLVPPGRFADKGHGVCSAPRQLTPIYRRPRRSGQLGRPRARQSTAPATVRTPFPERRRRAAGPPGSSHRRSAIAGAPHPAGPGPISPPGEIGGRHQKVAGIDARRPAGLDRQRFGAISERRGLGTESRPRRETDIERGHLQPGLPPADTAGACSAAPARLAGPRSRSASPCWNPPAAGTRPSPPAARTAGRQS